MPIPPKNSPSKLNLLRRAQYWGRLLFRRDTPWKVKAILAVAIMYLLSPFDLVPDWIVGLGFLDDLTVVSLLVAWAIKIAEKNKK
jgi:uncharacterized membrane protein YkvA (DUF1232 family)